MMKSFKKCLAGLTALCVILGTVPGWASGGNAELSGAGQSYYLKDGKFEDVAADGMWKMTGEAGGSARTAADVEVAGNSGRMLEVTRPNNSASCTVVKSLEEKQSTGTVFVTAMFYTAASSDGKLGDNTIEFVDSSEAFLGGVGLTIGEYASVSMSGTKRTYTKQSPTVKHTKNKWALFQVKLDLDAKRGSYRVYETDSYQGSESSWMPVVESSDFELEAGASDVAGIRVYTGGGQKNERIMYYDNVMVYSGEELDFTQPLPQAAAELIDEVFATYPVAGSVDGITSIGPEGEVSEISLVNSKGERMAVGVLDGTALSFDQSLESGLYYVKIDSNYGFAVKEVRLGSTVLEADDQGCYPIKIDGQAVTDLQIAVAVSALVKVSGTIAAPRGRSGNISLTLTDTRLGTHSYTREVSVSGGSADFEISEVLGGCEYQIDVDTGKSGLIPAENLDTVAVGSEDYTGLELLLRSEPEGPSESAYFRHTEFTADELSEYAGEIYRDRLEVFGNATEKLRLGGDDAVRASQPISGESRFSTVFLTGNGKTTTPLLIQLRNQRGEALISLGVDAAGNLAPYTEKGTADASGALLSKLVGKSGNTWTKVDVVTKNGGARFLVTAAVTTEFQGKDTVWSSPVSRQVAALQKTVDGNEITDQSVAQVRLAQTAAGDVYFDDISIGDGASQVTTPADLAAEKLPELLENYLGQMLHYQSETGIFEATGRTITLPDKADGGVGISWEIQEDPDGIAALSGNQLTLTQGSEAKTVVLTAQLTYKGQTGAIASASRDIVLSVQPKLEGDEDAKATARQLRVLNSAGVAIAEIARITDAALTLEAPAASVNGEKMEVSWKSDSSNLIVIGNRVSVSRESNRDVTAHLTGTVKVENAESPEQPYVAQKNYTLTIVKRGGNSGGGGGGSSHIGGRGGAVSGPVSYPVAPSGSQIPIETIELPFPDMEDYSWAIEAVIYLKNQGVLMGTSETTFEPDRIITREEFVTALVRLFDLDTTYTQVDIGMNDVDYSSWYAPYIIAAYQFNIIQGYSADTFGVGQPVTREEISVMVKRMVDFFQVTLPKGAEKTFKDAANISDWAAEAVALIQEAGIIQGYEDGAFRPQEGAKRAEVAKILYELAMAKNLKLKPSDVQHDPEAEGTRLPLPENAEILVKDFSEISDIRITGKAVEELTETGGNSSSKLKVDCSGQAASLQMKPVISQGSSGSFGYCLYTDTLFNGGVRFYSNDLTLLELRFKSDGKLVVLDGEGEEREITSYPIHKWVKMVYNFNLEPDEENKVTIKLETYTAEKYRGDDTAWEKYDEDSFTQTGDTGENEALVTDMGLSGFEFTVAEIGGPVLYLDDLYQVGE